ncbi:MAG TPA: P27 family phage terminase small subunit [Actinomycetota bacterium]|nr:P27 family phage terminase small subunit [Actinomycetota bacterium]
MVADCRAASGGANVDLDLAGELLRVRDRLDEIRRVLADEGLVTEGSTGQRRAHPLVAVEESLRSQLLGISDRLLINPSKRGWNVRVSKDGRLQRGK